jgi:predicted phage terminase large subunit-like protein
VESLSLSNLPLRYSFLDPAGGKRGLQQLKKVSARSAIIVLAPDALGRLFVVEAWARRCSTPELVEEIFRINAQWQPKQFGVEANAMQSLFADSLELLAKERGVRIPLVPVYQNTKIDKFFRLRTTLQPVISTGKLVIGEDQQELRNELKAFPMGQTVDLVDALASAVSLVPVKPPEESSRQEADALADYLRKVGAPASYIEKRVGEFLAQGRYKVANTLQEDANGRPRSRN